MSIFDVTNQPSPKFKFFNFFDKTTEISTQRKPLFEGSIIFKKRSGALQKCFMIIVDDKLVLFKVI
jgi:hypothetical protein